jgi:hypothetical protein
MLRQKAVATPSGPTAPAIRPMNPDAEGGRKPSKSKPSVNQMPPSGAAVMSAGYRSKDARGNSVMIPDGVIRPILFPSCSVNQTSPSGPTAIAAGSGAAGP